MPVVLKRLNSSIFALADSMKISEKEEFLKLNQPTCLST